MGDAAFKTDDLASACALADLERALLRERDDAVDRRRSAGQQHLKVLSCEAPRTTC